MKWLLSLLLTGLLYGAPGPHLFYSRAFPGSVPPYLQLTLDKDGNGEYAEAADDDLPVKFRLPESDAAQIFALAEKLGNFQRPIESPAKVAFTGAKIFRYENGSEKHEVKFNYSEDLVARELLDWFERMAETAQRRIDLERAAKYDKLGVPGVLVLLQSAMNHKRLVGLEQFLPMLDRIAKNETYMHTARVRASEIAEAIRTNQP